MECFAQTFQNEIGIREMMTTFNGYVFHNFHMKTKQEIMALM